MNEIWEQADAVKHWLSLPAAAHFRLWLKSLLEYDNKCLTESTEEVSIFRAQGAAARTKKILGLSDELDQFLSKKK